MTEFIKTLFASAIVLLAACGMASCSSDSDDEPEAPGTTVVPNFTFECKSFLCGGSTTNNNGHITGTPSEIVAPVFENENTIVTTLYRNPSVTVDGVTTGGEEFVYIDIFLSTKDANEGWKLTSSKFTYDGVSYDSALKVPYNEAKMGKLVKVEWKYTVERDQVKENTTRNLNIMIVDKMPK